MIEPRVCISTEDGWERGVVAAIGLTGIAAAAVTGAVAGFTGGFMMGLVPGLDPGDALIAGFKGAIFGAVGAIAAYGIADYISSAFPGIDGHAISLFTARRAVGYTAALTKAVMHGIVRGVINVIQNGGRFISAFASAFVSSAFSVGRYTFGRAAVFARTAVMAMVGGFASVISGGKFLGGAVSAAFVHLFNGEWSYFARRAARKIWKLNPKGTSKVMRHSKYGKFYKSKSDGLWWSRDMAGHGGSKWKVYTADKRGLHFYADADDYGDFIVAKHKGPTGQYIPWKELHTVRISNQGWQEFGASVLLFLDVIDPTTYLLPDELH